MTVTDSADQAVGIITASNVIVGYGKPLAVSTKRPSQLAGNAVPLEARVGEGTEVAGRAVRDAALPAGTIIVTTECDGNPVFEGSRNSLGCRKDTSGVFASSGHSG